LRPGRTDIRLDDPIAARCATTKPASTSLLWVFQRLLYALEPKNEYPLVPGKV
jgi:hypothetical protein